MSLGINKKNENIKNIFTIFSKSDFSHDFSKTKDIPPLIELLEKTIPIYLNNMPKNKYITKLKELTPKIRNGSIYDFFKENYTLILPDGSVGDAINEDKLLKNIIDLNYLAIRRILLDFTPNLDSKTLPESIPFTIDNEDLKRKYEISFYPSKNGEEHYNLPHAFKKVSDKNKFVLIIDATYLAISSIGLEEYLKNQYIGDYDKNETYEFYILENNENNSDSAKKRKKYENDNNNIKIYFLREPENHQVTYPQFTSHSQESNLYTNIELTTKKNLNKIDGILKIKGKEYSREDIGKISEIGQSALYAFQTYILNNNVINEDVMSYFFLKRAGDWCQALSLLDFGREYNIYDSNNVKKGTTTTLAALQVDHTIGLVTHDRILLGYSLLLGLNVFYSIRVVKTGNGSDDSNSVIWLAYFKNIDNSINISDYKKILEDKDSNIEKITDYTETAKRIFNEFIDNIVRINFINKPVDDIIKLRKNLILINELYIEEEFQKKTSELLKLYSEIPDEITNENKKIISSKLSSIRSLLKSFDIMNKRNNEIKHITSYDTEESEREVINKLYKLDKIRERVTYHNDYIRLVISKIKEDYLELKSKNIHERIKNFINTINEEPNELTRQALVKYKQLILPLKRLLEQQPEVEGFAMLVEGGYKIQTGGTIESIVARLKVNSIPEEYIDKSIKYYNDKSGNFYTNYDEYLVTHNELNILKEGLRLIYRKDKKDFNISEKYLYKRFILLYLDELFTDLFSLRGMIQYEKNVAQFEDELFLNFLRIDFQLEYIKKGEIKNILDTYFTNREKWGPFFLLGELHRLERHREGDRYNFNKIADRIANNLNAIKFRVLNVRHHVTRRNNHRPTAPRNRTKRSRFSNNINNNNSNSNNNNSNSNDNNTNKYELPKKGKIE